MNISKENIKKLENNFINLLDEYLFIDYKNKFIYNCYNQKISFENINKVINQYKNVNVINKPIWIILYTKLKNNDLSEIEFKPIINEEKMFKEIKTYTEIFKD